VRVIESAPVPEALTRVSRSASDVPLPCAIGWKIARRHLERLGRLRL
jgi:hypothetical protein